MVINNHLAENRKALDKLLLTDKQSGQCISLSEILAHMRFLANIEKVLIVVSDMSDCKSHIIAGKFALNLDIGEYQQENSIWRAEYYL